MPPRPPHSQRRAAEALVAVAVLLARLIERLLAGGEPPLSLAAYLALRALASGQASGGELARQAAVSGPAISQLLGALERGGLIERGPVAEDRRRQALALSPRGARALAEANARVGERVGELVAGLPAPELDALARALPELEAILAGTPPPRRPPPPRPPRRAPPGPRP
jgi:DNA-binding MarR family transcriptional regulator